MLLPPDLSHVEISTLEWYLFSEIWNWNILFEQPIKENWITKTPLIQAMMISTSFFKLKMKLREFSQT